MATDQERLSAAETMAVILGDFVETILDEIRSWPRFSFNRKRRWVLEGRMVQSVRNYHDWVTLFLPRGEET